MGEFLGAYRVGYAISVGLGRAIGAAFRSLRRLLGPSNPDLGPVIARAYSDIGSFQTEARVLVGGGYVISSIAGLTGHTDFVRAAIDGTLGDLAHAAVGIRTAEKIVVVYERRPG